MSLKFQQKSIEDPAEISLIFNWKSIGNPNGNPFEIQLEFDSNFCGMPVETSVHTDDHTCTDERSDD